MLPNERRSGILLGKWFRTRCLMQVNDQGVPLSRAFPTSHCSTPSCQGWCWPVPLGEAQVGNRSQWGEVGQCRSQIIPGTPCLYTEAWVRSEWHRNLEWHGSWGLCHPTTLCWTWTDSPLCEAWVSTGPGMGPSVEVQALGIRQSPCLSTPPEIIFL